MKDNLNIEELFQDKFNSFEGEVSPDAWVNIQQGMSAAGAASTGASTGMGLLMKGVIVGGIVAATVMGIYLFSETAEQEVTPENNLVVNDHIDNRENNVIANRGVQGENLPKNTIYGLNMTNENDTDRLTNKNTNTDGVNNSSEINEPGITDNGITDLSNPSEDDSNTNRAVNTNGAGSDDGDQGVDSDNRVIRESIANPAAGVLDVEYITVNPTFETKDEHAPTACAFHANTENALSVEWLFEDGTVKSGEDVEFKFDKSGTYKVVMTAYGDAEPVSKTIEVVIKSNSSIDTLPNIFSPTVRDRQNDFFAIATTNIETFEIIITNNQGETVYESTDVYFRWNGTDLRGEELPTGVYYYTFFAKGNDGATYKDTRQVTLK